MEGKHLSRSEIIHLIDPSHSYVKEEPARKEIKEKASKGKSTPEKPSSALKVSSHERTKRSNSDDDDALDDSEEEDTSNNKKNR